MGIIDQAIAASSNNGQPVLQPTSTGPSLPDQVVNGMTLPHDDVMSQMPWGKLIDLRNQAGNNVQAQSAIAPYEHRAYARENVGLNPVSAAVWAGMPIAYQAGKILGVTPSDSQTTPASFKQFAQGELGVAEGIKNGIVNKVSGWFK